MYVAIKNYMFSFLFKLAFKAHARRSNEVSPLNTTQTTHDYLMMIDVIELKLILRKSS